LYELEVNDELFKYKFSIFLRLSKLLVIFLVVLAVVILENLCIFLKAPESLDTELPELEKSIELLDRLESIGIKIRLEGVLLLLPKFFFW
jgi:hypothetical protein